MFRARATPERLSMFCDAIFLVGLGICICCLLVYLWPEAPAVTPIVE